MSAKKTTPSRSPASTAWRPRAGSGSRPTPFSGALFAFGNRARMAINVLVSEVHRLDGHPGTHVRRDVDHRAAQNALHSASRPAKPSPRSSTRLFAPRASAISTTHVG
jgi:hypothetical protein